MITSKEIECLDYMTEVLTFIVNVSPESSIIDINIESFDALHNEYKSGKNRKGEFDVVSLFELDKILMTVHNFKDKELYSLDGKTKSIMPIQFYIFGKHNLKRSCEKLIDLSSTINHHFSCWKTIASENGANIDEIEKKHIIQQNRLKKLEDIKILYRQVLDIMELSKSLDDDYIKIEPHLIQDDGHIKDLTDPSLELYLSKYKELESYLNHPDLIINKDQFTSVEKLYEYYEIEDILIKSKEYIDSISDTIIEQKGIYFNDAQKYVMNEKKVKTDLSTFLLEKEGTTSIDEDIYTQIEIKGSKKYSKFIAFNDFSSLMKDAKGNTRVFRDNTEAGTHIKPFCLELVDSRLNKNPTISKYLKSILLTNFRKLTSLGLTINTFLENKEILKSNNFTFNGDKVFEELDDRMNKCVLNHKVRQFAHSIASSKYKHLYNEESYKVFTALYNLNIDQQILQNMIGKKLASYKNADDFNLGLNKLLDGFNEFSMEKLKDKANINNSPIISDAINILILKIDNFEQSKALGSPSWCISRDSYYYNSYTSQNAKQYFMYNFNKDSKDNDSMIGITLYNTGEISTAHYKNDDHYKTDEFLKYIQLKIIQQNLNDFPTLSEHLKKAIYDKKPNNTMKITV